jgi:phosphoglycolate phosphatase-like HAD superfamily hydrolase
MRRLAFVDLDLTLFNYTATRRRATAAAVLAMGGDTTAAEARFVSSVIVPYGDLLEELGFPNFRRAWKASELFGLVLLMRNARFGSLKRGLSTLLRRSLHDGVLSGEAGGSAFRSRWARRSFLLDGAAASGIDDLSSHVRTLLRRDRERRIVHEAVRVFEDYLRVHMREFRGAETMLDRLQEKGFEVYVVSEGEEFIQKEKLSFLRSGSRILGTFVSGECCGSEALVADLWKIAVASGSEAGSGSRAADTLDAIGVLYDTVIEYSIKSPTFFRKVLQTVLLPMDRRSGFFRKFQWLSTDELEAADDVGLLLIGDRYEKDLLPAMRAFTTVMTIRLEAGKYRSSYRDDSLRQLGLPPPGATAHSPVISRKRIAAPSADPRQADRFAAALATLRAGAADLPRELVRSLEWLRRTLQAKEKRTDG